MLRNIPVQKSVLFFTTLINNIKNGYTLWTAYSIIHIYGIIKVFRLEFWTNLCHFKTHPFKVFNSLQIEDLSSTCNKQWTKQSNAAWYLEWQTRVHQCYSGQCYSESVDIAVCYSRLIKNESTEDNEQ